MQSACLCAIPMCPISGLKLLSYMWDGHNDNHSTVHAVHRHQHCRDSRAKLPSKHSCCRCMRHMHHKHIGVQPACLCAISMCSIADLKLLSYMRDWCDYIDSPVCGVQWYQHCRNSNDKLPDKPSCCCRLWACVYFIPSTVYPTCLRAIPMCSVADLQLLCDMWHGHDDDHSAVYAI